MIRALDIGGSSVKVAWVTLDSEASEPAVQGLVTIPLAPRTFAALNLIVCEQVAQERIGRKPDLVSISTTGAVGSTGKVVDANAIDGYSNVDWKRILSFCTSAPVYVFNDGLASAWGEHFASGPEPIAFVHAVVGTGVGGGIVIGGSPYHGVSGLAGLIGHLKLASGADRPCVCGQFGCCETYASAGGVLRTLAELTAVQLPTFELAVGMAARGDEIATRAFALAGRALGQALGSVINLLNPLEISLGGGVIEASSLLGPGGGPYVAGVRGGVSESAVHLSASSTLIRLGSWGNRAGLIGAALLAAENAGP